MVNCYAYCVNCNTVIYNLYLKIHLPFINYDTMYKPTGCFRRYLLYYRRTFLMLNYIVITKKSVSKEEYLKR